MTRADLQHSIIGAEIAEARCGLLGISITEAFCTGIRSQPAVKRLRRRRQQLHADSRESMNEEDDLSALEQRMRAKLETMQAKPAEQDATEKAMIAKLFGTKTEAEDFLRHEGRATSPVQKSRIDLRRPKTFKSQKPVIRFEYWDSYSSVSSRYVVERYENGVRVMVREFNDKRKRDELLLKLQAAGVTCNPITVAGNVPAPIEGPQRAVAPVKPKRASIMSQIGKLTTNDLENNE